MFRCQKLFTLRAPAEADRRLEAGKHGPYLGYMEPGALEGCGESLGASKLEVWELASFHHFLERLGEAFKTTIGDNLSIATLRRVKQSRLGVPILNNVKEVSKKFLRCDEERILFKINSKIAQDPSKVSSNPPKTFQNRSKIDPKGFLEPILDQCFKKTAF